MGVGDASPLEGTKSPSKSVWRRASRKDYRNICDSPRDGKRREVSQGREDTRDNVQRGRLEPAHAVDKV